MLSAATGVVQADSRVSSQPGWCVESGHEFTVGGAGGGEVFLAFVELLLKVEVVLFELADALVEGVDMALSTWLGAQRDRGVQGLGGWVSLGHCQVGELAGRCQDRWS